MLRQFFCWVLISLCWGGVSSALAETPDTIHHRLSVILDPDSHSIQGSDEITLSPPQSDASSQSFLLNPSLNIKSIRINDQDVPLNQLTIESTEHAQKVTILTGPRKYLRMTVTFAGIIDDTPKASTGLRFVRPDKTTGHIGNNGVYLTSETFWYPTWDNVLSTFDLRMTLPSDWQAITQGQETSNSVEGNRRIIQWKIHSPSEALTLAANRFVVQKTRWRDKQLATYLFPDEAELAPQYLEATATYLDLYTKLLGPYPFSQFSVVENFFPSGLGLPSFTLLGQRVVRRGYTQPYSLGHEIVHSWFGNSVFNDFAKGNWVEGLTTYLANYYYDEATGNIQEALKTRHRMIHEYNLYATPEKEYPIRQFHHKETRLDNAIGYQKTALVFHMLRQKLGDDTFFKGVREVVQEGTGQYIEWKDLERIFSKVADQNLTEFFTQWIEQPGTPSLTLDTISVQPEPLHPGHTKVSGTIIQKGPIYKLQLPIQIKFHDQVPFNSVLSLAQASQPFKVKVSGIPKSIRLDPEHDLLLRVKRGNLPPMLNTWATDSHRILVRAKTPITNEEKSLEALMRRVQRQPDIQIRQNDSPAITEAASYLILGTPAQKLLESQALETCNQTVQMEPGRLTIQKEEFEGSEMAFLITCPHPNSSDHTVSLFFGLSPEAVQPVARLLFFYGWDSYLAFKQGNVIARGMFQPVHSAREFIIPTP